MNQFLTHTLSSLKKYKCVTFVLDSSGSIAAGDFSCALCATNCFVEKLDPGILVRILNFSDIVSEDLPFTSDRELISKTIPNIQQKKQCTNFEPAMDMSMKGFTLYPNGRHMIILITDGVPSDKPEKAIRRLLRMNLDMYVLAIGDYNKQYLKNQFGDMNVFEFTNYKELNNVINQFTPQVLPFTVNIYSGSKTYQKSTEPLNLEVAINIVKVNIKIPPNEIKIVILDNEYYSGNTYTFHEPLEYDKEKRLNIKLHLKQDAKNHNVPGEVKFIVHYLNFEYPGSFLIDFAWLFGDLITPRDINICMNGNIGVGKSTLLQSFANLITSIHRIIDTIFTTSNNPSKHCTQDFSIHPWSRILEKLDLVSQSGLHRDIYENIRLSFFDKWGIYKLNNESFNIKHAALGRYIPDMSLNSKIDSRELKDNPDNAIHVFIHLFPIKSIVCEEDTIQMKSHIQDTIDAGLTPILVVNMYDDLDEEDIIKLKLKILNTLGVQEANIFYVIPYLSGQFIRSPQIDSILFSIIKRVVEIGYATLLKKITIANDKVSPAKLKELEKSQNQMVSVVNSGIPSNEEISTAFKEITISNQIQLNSNLSKSEIQIGGSPIVDESTIVGENQTKFVDVNVSINGETMEFQIQETENYIGLKKIISNELGLNQNEYIFKYGNKIISMQPVELLKSGINFSSDILTITKKPSNN